MIIRSACARKGSSTRRGAVFCCFSTVFSAVFLLVSSVFSSVSVIRSSGFDSSGRVRRASVAVTFYVKNDKFDI